MSTSLFKRARIAIPLGIVLVLIAVFCFMGRPGISTGDGDSCTVTTLPASDVSVTTATLNGIQTCIAGLLPAHSVFADPVIHDLGFMWGPYPGGPYPYQTVGQWAGGFFFANLTGLSPATTYYFKAYGAPWDTQFPLNNKVFASAYNYGVELSFTTLGSSGGSNPLTDGGGNIVGGAPNVTTTNVNTGTNTASVNQPVTVYANVVNRGEIEGGFTVDLKVNGQIEQSYSDVLPAKTGKQVEFTLVKDVPGVYTIDVGGKTTILTIVPAPDESALSRSQSTFIALGILVIAAIALVVLLVMRRRTNQ
jgi:hypothetical protein